MNTIIAARNVLFMATSRLCSSYCQNLSLQRTRRTLKKSRTTRHQTLSLLPPPPRLLKIPFFESKFFAECLLKFIEPEYVLTFTSSLLLILLLFQDLHFSATSAAKYLSFFHRTFDTTLVCNCSGRPPLKSASMGVIFSPQTVFYRHQQADCFSWCRGKAEEMFSLPLSLPVHGSL